jgi:ADP-dependent NAD(P)H-hydrate dehydratase
MPGPEIVTPELLREWPLPDPRGDKKARGQVVIIGGAARTPGGVALAGLAALRVGAGHVQLAVARTAAPPLAATFPEAGVIALAETDGGTVLGAAAAEACAEAAAGADAVLVGPGLDDADETRALLVALLPLLEDETALVLDAYALGVLPDLREQLAARPGGATLTPNPKELGLLLGQDDDAEAGDVPGIAESYGSTVTSLQMIATPDGRLWRVPAGHSGLATAGSGDVLAGLVAGLLARGADPAQAACWGTYLHATAGERLASSIGGVGFLARELVDQVPPVLAELG